MSRLEQMFTFIKVIEKRGFAKAGKELKISPAAVSKQIVSLEKSLGIKLIQRSTRSLQLTEPGEMYFQQCKRILQEIEEADSMISLLKKEPSGDLVVLASKVFAESLIVPHIKEFMTRYPKITLNLEMAERIPDFSLENIDLCIGMSIQAPPHIIQKTIGRTRYILAASPDYLKKYGVPKKIKDLEKHLYIAHSMRRPDTLVWKDNKREVHLKPILRLNDTKAMLECGEAGIGMIKVHQYVAKEALREGSLVEILKSDFLEEVPIFIYHKEMRLMPSKIRCFIDFMTEKLEAFQETIFSK